MAKIGNRVYMGKKIPVSATHRFCLAWRPESTTGVFADPLVFTLVGNNRIKHNVDTI